MMENDGEIRRLRVGRTIVPALQMVFCVGYGFLILELPQEHGEEYPSGPSFMPWLWVLLLITLTLLEIGATCFDVREKRARVSIARKSVLDALLLVLLLTGFALSIQRIGFFSAAAAFLTISTWWSGVRAWGILLPYAIIFAALVNYIFHHVLQVPLPQEGLF